MIVNESKLMKTTDKIRGVVRNRICKEHLIFFIKLLGDSCLVAVDRTGNEDLLKRQNNSIELALDKTSKREHTSYLLITENEDGLVMITQINTKVNGYDILDIYEQDDRVLISITKGYKTFYNLDITENKDLSNYRFKELGLL